MKKTILKPVITEDMRRLYNFFQKNSNTYCYVSISANSLARIMGYKRKDITTIIKSINNEKRFKNVIIGCNEGYYFIDKSNKKLAIRILLEKTNKCYSELESIINKNK